MGTSHMEEQPRGLSQEQQNQCRATLNRFIDEHGLSGWEMTIEVKESDSGEFNVRLQITPPPESGSPPWPIREIAVADSSFDVAAELDHLLHDAFKTAPAGLKAN